MALPDMGATSNNDWSIWDTSIHSPLTADTHLRAVRIASCRAYDPDHLRTPDRIDDNPYIVIRFGRSLGRRSWHLFLMGYPGYRRTY
jgi:hypothetical protein